MGAVRMLAASDLRRRWRSVLALVLLVGLAGGVVLAAVAGARRTSSALSRFESVSRSATEQVITGFGAPTAAQVRAFTRIPGIESVAVVKGFAIRIPAAPQLSPVAAVDTKLGTVVDRARIIAGRQANPNAVDEVAIGENLAAQLHRTVGDHLDAQSLSPAQVAAVVGGADDPGPPAGPRLRLHIVGIVRRPEDLGRKGALGGVFVLTPAFARHYTGRIGLYGSGLRLRSRGAPDLPRLHAAALRIFGRSPLLSVSSAAGDVQGTQNAIDVLVVALSIFAGIGAAAVFVTLTIVVSRQIALADADQEVLRAIGSTRRQRIATSGPRAVIVASGGGLLAAVVAILASPLFPIGVARRAEPDLGVHADGLVLVAGVAAVILVVLAISLVAAIRTTRPPRPDLDRSTRPLSATIPEFAGRAGMTPAAANGLRMALQPGRGRTAVPVRSALVGAVFGVFGVIAVVVFGASLNRLVTTPRRYGWTWDFSATDTISAAPTCTRDTFGLGAIRGIGAIGVACYGTDNIQVDGHSVNGWSFASIRGSIEPTVVSGRAPRNVHEVALGSQTMQTLSRHIGQTVRATGPHGHGEYRIVGQVVFPTLTQTQPIANGAAFTSAGFAPIFDQDNYYRYLLGRFAPGADRAAVERRVAAISQLDPPITPTLPVEVDRLHQIDWFPLTLAFLLGGLAVIAVGYALVSAVRRRRRDLALFKTLGFDRGQVHATVAWQATTLGTVGLVAGIPLGLITGSTAWRLVADGLGVANTPAVPLVAVLATIPAVIVGANLIAYLPGRSAARTRPAVILRTE